MNATTIRTAKVYVPYVPQKREGSSFVPTINIQPAAEHGEVVIMMTANARFHPVSDLIRDLSSLLSGYDYEAGDCFVAVGDPAIIAVASAILGRQGKFTILKWDRTLGRYIPTKIIF